MQNKWVMGLVVPLIVAGFSAVASWRIAINTTEQSLARSIHKTNALADNVGYRYFRTLEYVIMKDPNESEKLIYINREAKRGYKRTLEDILKDFRSLVSNPAFTGSGGKAALFADLQVIITGELAQIEKREWPMPTTLRTMCEIYFGTIGTKKLPGLWDGVTQTAVSKREWDLHQIAKKRCDANQKR
ncbi:MAG: hypothetical protein OXF11_11310 [Deltaproteobacteria bacterium]|nr:hypothetical protein [Deltaproteobacteria bacterium]